MKPLSQRDCQHWEAALQLHRLGQYLEADRALGRIAPQRHTHPDVLELRLEILIKTEHWQACADVAETLVALYPKNPLGWIHRALALRALNRTQEAFNLLVPAVEKLPSLWIIPYILASCSAKLKRPAEAKQWLTQALALDQEMVNLEVLEDAQLQRLLHALPRNPKPAATLRRVPAKIKLPPQRR